MKTSRKLVAGYGDIGRSKTGLPACGMFLLGMFAGAFIALGALGSLIAGSVTGRLAGALVSPVGLTMAILSGAELFTGNCLLSIPLRNRVIDPKKALP